MAIAGRRQYIVVSDMIFGFLDLELICQLVGFPPAFADDLRCTTKQLTTLRNGYSSQRIRLASVSPLAQRSHGLQLLLYVLHLGSRRDSVLLLPARTRWYR